MSHPIDSRYLQSQIDRFRALAKAALHPDVEAAYQSYVRHYETLLQTLMARRPAMA